MCTFLTLLWRSWNQSALLSLLWFLEAALQQHTGGWMVKVVVYLCWCLSSDEAGGVVGAIPLTFNFAPLKSLEGDGRRN